MRRHGISSVDIQRVRGFRKNLLARTAERPFSTTFFLENLRKNGVRFAERSLRGEFRKLLAKYQYLDPNVERLLHMLRKRGFKNIILSWGNAPYQYQKIRTACRASFLRHFSKIIVTTKHKYAAIEKLMRRFPQVQTFFIDDSKEHIGLVKKHVPSVITLHFTKNRSLNDVKREVLRHAPRGRKASPGSRSSRG